MKKLWDKGSDISTTIEKFTIGNDQALDLQLAKFDVLGSIAHSKMLANIGLLTPGEQKVLHSELIAIYRQIEAGEFSIQPGVEDIHSQIEILLTESLGDIGKKIHTARSRNDQVLVDLRLFFRNEIENIVERTKELFDKLIHQSEVNKAILMPGYTHMQVAMVSSFGLWFGAFAESLADDLKILHAAYKVINQNPLGSAAGYGSSLPIDRELTTDLLGFDDLSYNSINAQFGRGKSELFLAFGIASISGTLNKMASDVCQFMSQNYGFINLPDDMTTGSSIMPHKKNPDVFELIRGKCTQLLTLPQQVISLTTNLPSGYHRDFQLMKETVFPAIETLKDVLEICRFAISKMTVKKDLLADPKYRLLFTVEEVNTLVISGIPFRKAYNTVRADVASGNFFSSKEINHTHQGSIGNLCNKEIERKMVKTISSFHFEKVHTALLGLLNASP